MSSYRCILLVLFQATLISFASAVVSIENDCKENTMNCQSNGSACRNVYQFFGDSSCQPNIKQYIEDAMNTVLTRQNKSDESLDDQIKALAAKIEALERKIDDKLDRCTSNTSKESWRFGNLMSRIGYEYYERDRFWYKFHNECKSWFEARQVCQHEGGDLISLKESNYNFFKDEARSKAGTCLNVWVGATDIPLEGQWYWLNGERVSSIFWPPGQPDNYGSNENCGLLWPPVQYSLNDGVCSSSYHFLCQITLI